MNRIAAVLPVVLVAACVSDVSADPAAGAPAAAGAFVQPPWARLTCPAAPVLVQTPVTVTGEVPAGVAAELSFPPSDHVEIGTAATHVYDAPGTFTVVLAARDERGEEARARCRVVVVDPMGTADDGVDDGVDDGPSDGDDGVVDDGAADDDGAGDPGDAVDDGATTSPTTGALRAAGVQLDWYWMWGFPEWFGEQIGEDVVRDALATPALDVAATLPLSFAGVQPGLRGVPGFADASPRVVDPWGAPADELSGMVALVLDGTVTPPAGAVTVDVDVSGGDVVTVALDDAVVASADAEHALDDGRTERAPPAVAGLAVDGPLAIRVVVASKTGPMAWDVALAFRDAQGALLGPGTVGD